MFLICTCKKSLANLVHMTLVHFLGIPKPYIKVVRNTVLFLAVYAFQLNFLIHMSRYFHYPQFIHVLNASFQ